jgi:hypothetical protein
VYLYSRNERLDYIAPLNEQKRFILNLIIENAKCVVNKHGCGISGYRDHNSLGKIWLGLWHNRTERVKW